MNCGNCGNLLSANAAYCSACGTQASGAGSRPGSSSIVVDVSRRLYDARGWLKFLAVISIIGGAISILSIIGILFAWLPIWMGVVLWKAAIGIEQAGRDGDTDALATGLSKLATYFKINAIATLVPVVIVPVLILAAIAIPALLRRPTGPNESAAIANLRTINTAEVTYLSSSGGTYGEIGDLVREGLLDTSFERTRAGYSFDVQASGTEYTATAKPASSNTGRWGYFSNPDAVVRYSTEEGLSPPGQSGEPVQ
jgi:type II secretory pathway pseudopilin PulG